MFIFLLGAGSLFNAADTLAQQTTFSYGVKTGINLSGSSYRPDFHSRVNLKKGFMVGFSAEYAMNTSCFLQSGLYFSNKGAEYKGSDIWLGSSKPPVTFWVNTIHQLYMQIPLALAFKKSLRNKIKITGNAGPYVAYGIGGRNITKKNHTGVNLPDEKVWTNTFGKKGVKRFDVGLTVGGGIELKQIQLGINYEPSFKDVNYKYSDNIEYEYRNRNLTFWVAYKL